MHKALVPYEITCTFVAVYPFLLPALFAMYSSEAYFNFKLFASCFLLASACGAGEKSARIFDTTLTSIILISCLPFFIFEVPILSVPFHRCPYCNSGYSEEYLIPFASNCSRTLFRSFSLSLPFPVLFVNSLSFFVVGILLLEDGLNNLVLFPASLFGRKLSSLAGAR